MYNYQNTLFPQLQNLSQQLAPLAQMTQMQQPQHSALEVSGRPGAEAFPMGPNETALLLDNTAPILWVVKTDSGGYKTLSPFDISPHDEKKQEDVIKSLEDRISRLEERLSHDKQSFGNSETKQQQQHKSDRSQANR